MYIFQNSHFEIGRVKCAMVFFPRGSSLLTFTFYSPASVTKNKTGEAEGGEFYRFIDFPVEFSFLVDRRRNRGLEFFSLLLFDIRLARLLLYREGKALSCTEKEVISPGWRWI